MEKKALLAVSTGRAAMFEQSKDDGME